MKQIRYFVIAVSMLFVCLFSGCKKNTPKTSHTVHIAIQPSAAFIPLYIARYQGLVEEALKSSGVTVEWQDFESGPPMIQALSAGLSDIGVIGDVPTVSALSDGSSMKVVGIPATGPDAYAMLSRAHDNSFVTAADMKGKKIATVFGSTGHNFTKKLLSKYGLSFDDIEFVSIAAGDAENDLASGLCDAVVIWEPNVSRLVNKGIAKVVAYGSETDLRGTNAFVVRSEYLVAHKDVIKIILEQYYKAVQLIPELDEKSLSKLAGALSISPEQVKSIAAKYDFSVTVTKTDIDSLQDTVSFLVDIGNLSVPYKIINRVDNLFTLEDTL